MKTRTALHKRQHREDYYALAHLHATDGLTDQQLGTKMGWDWSNNGNKRVKRIADRLELFAIRTKIKKEGPFRWFKRFNDLQLAQRQWIKIVENGDED